MEFLATLAFCEKIGFAKPIFSPIPGEKGTAAEKNAGPGAKIGQGERARLLAAAARPVGKGLSRAFYRKGPCPFSSS
jgi:hypothetical protein